MVVATLRRTHIAGEAVDGAVVAIEADFGLGEVDIGAISRKETPITMMPLLPDYLFPR